MAETSRAQRRKTVARQEKLFYPSLAFGAFILAAARKIANKFAFSLGSPYLCRII
jgi:hypothetical protein